MEAVEGFSSSVLNFNKRCIVGLLDQVSHYLVIWKSFCLKEEEKNLACFLSKWIFDTLPWFSLAWLTNWPKVWKAVTGNKLGWYSWTWNSNGMAPLALPSGSLHTNILKSSINMIPIAAELNQMAVIGTSMTRGLVENATKVSFVFKNGKALVRGTIEVSFRFISLCRGRVKIQGSFEGAGRPEKIRWFRNAGEEADYSN